MDSKLGKISALRYILSFLTDSPFSSRDDFCDLPHDVQDAVDSEVSRLIRKSEKRLADFQSGLGVYFLHRGETE